MSALPEELPDGVSPPLTMDVLIERYVKLRDRIKQVEDANKQKLAPAKEMLEQLNAQILDQINNSGADSIATANGTAYRTEKVTASIEDSTEFSSFVIANEQWDMLDWKANKTAVEAYLKEFEALPPGVKISTAYVAGVRRSNKG